METEIKKKIADWSLEAQSTYAIQFKVTKLQITKTPWSATKHHLYLGFISSGELTDIILQKTLSLEEESLEEENKQIGIALDCPEITKWNI